MENLSVLLIVGSAVIVALVAGKAVGRFYFPMVIGYVIAGCILGKSFLGVFNEGVLNKTGIINDLALGIIAFMIGGELNFSRLKKLGKSILTIAIFESTGAFFMVTFLSYFFTGKIYCALILGAIASATAPAATVAVINQYKARGPLTTTILGIVGIDDGIALIIYSFVSILSYHFITGAPLSLGAAILLPTREIFFSFLAGGIFGIFLSYFLNKMKSREEIFALVIGMVLILEGIASQANFSELLSVMSMAVVSNNLSFRKTDSAIKSLNIIGFPLIAAFFCLAGARLDITLLPRIGVLGIVYLVSRMAGKYAGARLGAKLSSASKIIKKYVGLSLWPQIGIAVALAIMVERDFGRTGATGKYLADLAVNILLFTTILTEIIGPLATKFSLGKAGEIKNLK